MMSELPGITEKQVWLTGTLSPRARKEIESRGWQVRDRAEAQLFSWVETYPDYKKPEERVPSGLVTLNMKSVALGVGASRGEGAAELPGQELSLLDLRLEPGGCRHLELYRSRESLRSEEPGGFDRHLCGKPGDLCHRRGRERHVDEE